MDLSPLTDYVIPYWHPLAVHFPLVLLLVAAPVALVYAVRGTTVWRVATLLLLLGAAPTAYWAAATGETLEEEVEGEPMADRFLDQHEDAAEWTVRVSFFALGVALGGSFWLRRGQTPEGLEAAKEPLWLRLAILVPVGIAAAFVAWTGHLGGLMVWGVPR